MRSYYENIPEIAELDMDNPTGLVEIPACQSRIEDITSRDEIDHYSFGNRKLAFDPKDCGVRASCYCFFLLPAYILYSQQNVYICRPSDLYL